MKRQNIILAIILSIIFILSVSSSAYAIDLPDSTPQVIDIWAFRNIIEADDMLVIVYENTPYSTTPNMTYSEAFTWKIYDTDNSTELGYALLSEYHDFGYGYSVVSFYFEESDNVTWYQLYNIKLEGLAAAFPAPPTYSYQMEYSNYSSETDQTTVQLEIADRIITLAKWLNNRWDLASDEKLTYESELGTKLSIEGQAFFREAIFGSQAMAPTIFPMYFSDVTSEDRTWTDAYVTVLEDQYTGTDLGDAITEGMILTDTDYNLFGLIIILAIVIMLVFGHWYLGGGNRWTGFIESAPVLVIGGRMALLGLGELGLVVALCWIYFTGRLWKVF